MNGATTVNNNLAVTGNTGLFTLGTSGLATLNTAKVNNLTGNGNRVVIAAPDGTLTTAISAGTTNEFVQNQNFNDQSASFRVNGTGQIGGTLNVGGGTTLNNTLNVAGQSTFNSLTGEGTRLVVATNTGLLATQPIPAPIDAILNRSSPEQSANFNINGSGRVGELTVNSSATINGNSTVAGTLGVSGASTLNSLGVTTSATVGGPLTVTGVTTLNGVNTLNGATTVNNILAVTGNTSLSTVGTSGLATLGSARVANLNGTGNRVVLATDNGTLVVGGAFPGSGDFISNSGSAAAPVFNVSAGQITGDIGVGGTATLAGLTAGGSTLGATTLTSTLNVMGESTFNSLIGSGTRLVVANNAGTLTTQALPDPNSVIKNDASNQQNASFYISGSGRVASTMGVGTELTVGTTLNVAGLSTLGQVTAGATSLASANVSGALITNTLQTNTTSSLLGNVGIGTVAGPERLTVAGNVVPSSDGDYNLGSEGTVANTALLRWNKVFTVNGTVQTSDARLKTNITGLGYGMSTVMALRPVRYAWKKTPNQTNKIGFIAQELQKVVPEVVSVGTDANQTLGVNYAELVPVLVKALQEQQAQLDTMRGRAEKAEAAVQSFESRLRALEAGSTVNATAQGQR
ncbi:tail fiber domain-containing protein [Hymenobacter humi]|uniref:Tail fiber domain-containing protein n=1 Tax=Hymenobacter humi TaxID=1411620 RepID=A0ABW2UAT3_9BACT